RGTWRRHLIVGWIDLTVRDPPMCWQFLPTDAIPGVADTVFLPQKKSTPPLSFSAPGTPPEAITTSVDSPNRHNPRQIRGLPDRKRVRYGIAGWEGWLLAFPFDFPYTRGHLGGNLD